MAIDVLVLRLADISIGPFFGPSVAPSVPPFISIVSLSLGQLDLWVVSLLVGHLVAWPLGWSVPH